MHKVLIVFDMVPETSHTFLVEVGDEALKAVKAAHGVLAGSVHPDEEKAMVVYHMLFEEETGKAKYPEFEGTDIPDGVKHLVKTGFAL